MSDEQQPLSFDEKAKNWDMEKGHRIRSCKISRIIQEEFPLQMEWNVLEVGCGTGLLGFNLLPETGWVTFADSSEGMLEIVRKKSEEMEEPRITLLPLDISSEEIPGQYDLVVSQMALHHMADTQSALAKMTSALKPGGRIGIADLETEDGSFHGRDVQVHYGFDSQQLVRELENYGLINIRVRKDLSIDRPQLDGSIRSYPLFVLLAEKVSKE